MKILFCIVADTYQKEVLRASLHNFNIYILEQFLSKTLCGNTFQSVDRESLPNTLFFFASGVTFFAFFVT